MDQGIVDLVILVDDAGSDDAGSDDAATFSFVCAGWD
jgi:hypothetical protein